MERKKFALQPTSLTREVNARKRMHRACGVGRNSQHHTLSPISSEERLDDVIDVELSQVGVLLTRADEQDRLPCLVAHGQRRAHLVPYAVIVSKEG